MHAQSLVDAHTSAVAAGLQVDPLRGQFGWVELVAQAVWDDEVGGDVACVILTPAGPLAEQAMPGLAEVLGLDPHPGARTLVPDGVSVTLTEPGMVSLHVRTVRLLRRPAPAEWRQLAGDQGWVRVVICYRHVDAADGPDDVLAGDGVTADVLVRLAGP